MEKYFNIRYEFDHQEVERRIDETLAGGSHGYIPVVDGVVLTTAQRDRDYMRVMDGILFAICDSSWVPLYVRWIYGHKRQQYSGSMIFQDLVRKKKADGSSKYRMAFIGTDTTTLEALRENIAVTMNGDVRDMLFCELPFCGVDEFDYPAIARMLEEDGAEVIWVALGAPKQEHFMSRLDKYMKRGVQIAVGAVFKFFSGCGERRASDWMVEMHLEFVYRLSCDPKKQMKRCRLIGTALPALLWNEWQRKKHGTNY